MSKLSPIIRGRITRDAKLALGGRGTIRICVDTGFTGGVALPLRLLRRLRSKLMGTEKYQLADGSMVTMRQWVGGVVVGQRDALLGMGLMGGMARKLMVDFDRSRWTLALRR